MDEKKAPKVSIGIVSLTVIFSVLCLAILSVLTFSTALTEKNFSDKRAVAQIAYYAAETECAEITNQIGELWQEKEKEAVQSFLENHEIVYWYEEERLMLFFQQKIDENQSLSVLLRLEDTGMKVERWQVVSTQDWVPDQGISVWNGEEM